LCITPVAAYQMVDTAYFCRRKLFVVKQNRYNEPVQVVKKALEANEFGKVYSFQINCFWNRPQEYYTGDWKGTKFLDGGILYTQFSHFIDLLYWLLGDVAEVKGFSKTFQERQHMELEDTGVASLLLKNGAMGTINFTINSFKKNIEGSFTLFGEKGTAKIGGQYLNSLEWFDTEKGDKPHVTMHSEANNYGFYQGSMSNHEQVYKDLVASLNGNGNLLEAKDAVKTIEIIEKIYKAIR
jgi:UDP-N-acetyl-2-amino-2-deoxyglucuronate dehydrogenase